MFFWDYTIFIMIPPLLLAVYAQQKVRNTFQKYSRISSSGSYTAADMAKEILRNSGAPEVDIEKARGRLTDHYDPRKRILRLSEGVYGSRSLAALGIAAHEAGHALQHHQKYAPLYLRNGIFPIANLGSSLAFPLFFIGFIFSRQGPSLLMDIGILLFSGAVVFSLLTLPVEFNASKRAMALLEQGGYLKNTELQGAKAVLSAAALTYVASTAMAAMQLLRMFILRGSRE